MKVSVIIPARNEPYLNRTIEDLRRKAAGDLEIIAVLDGYCPREMPQGIRIIQWGQSRGMRASITAGVEASNGEFILKTDAHCLFSAGWDEVLKANCEDDWIVVPRRYSLEAEKWAIKADKPAIDYHYLSCPAIDGGLHGRPWRERARERKHIFPVDDEMSSQGSCWFMTRKHWNRIGGMPEMGYGSFTQEFQQLGLMTWLGGGRVVVNKAVFYAHWHKSAGRGYFLSRQEAVEGERWCTDYWMNNRWAGRKYDLEWLIDKFSPVPGWETRNGLHNGAEVREGRPADHAAGVE